jgi:hypothetical protein
MSEKNDISHDLLMLERLQEYDCGEKTEKFLAHILSLNPDKALKLLRNYINGRTGSAIIHYENKYVRKIEQKPFDL